MARFRKTDQPDTGSFNRFLLAWVIAGLSIILALGIYVYRRRKGLNRSKGRSFKLVHLIEESALIVG